MKIKEELTEEFGRHEYLLESEVLSGYKKSHYEKILSKEATTEEYSSSLKFLSKCLSEHHREKVIILIDEYDVPLENAYFNGFYENMISFIRSLLEEALKTNTSLKFAVLTGCLRVSKESIFTGLNNFDIISITSVEYAECFGFTEDEVVSALKEYNLEDKMDIVKKWYDGYVFGKTEVYNPWSFIKYVKATSKDYECLPEAYWSNTSANSIIKNLMDKAGIKEQEEIEKLMMGESITKTIFEDITYNDIESNMDNLWNFLFFTGYLKKTGETFDGLFKQYELKIPNQEVLYIYKRKWHEWFQEKVEAKDHTVLYNSILQGDVDAFKRELNAFLGTTISFMDSRKNFYHGFLAGILVNIKDYKVKSNRVPQGHVFELGSCNTSPRAHTESGDGRGDIFLTCVLNKGIAVIFELKIAGSYKDLSHCCDIALMQIEEKKYEAELREEGYQNIIKYGIAFFRKDCEIKKYIEK